MTEYWDNNPFSNWNAPVKVVWGHEPQKVPNKSGVYAWYMPLRFYDGLTVEDNIKLYTDLDLWDGNATRKASIDFHWDRIELKAKRRKRKNMPSNLSQLDESTLSHLDNPLLLCSVLARPLYVGKAGNLRDRIEQHTDSNPTANTFNTRFNEWANTSSIAGRISVTDLLFMFVPIDNDGNNKDIIDNLEAVLIHLISPALSLK